MTAFRQEAAFWLAIALVAVAGVAAVKMLANSPTVGEKWPGLATLGANL